MHSRHFHLIGQQLFISHYLLSKPFTRLGQNALSVQNILNLCLR
jgi:hypothetical protein